ncbi:MAG: hypothetical protein ABEJ65_01515 [bacterium]
MSIALIVLLWMSLLLILGNYVVGISEGVRAVITGLTGISFLPFHFILGVISSLLALFSVVITMFYFIGTGKAVKEGVKEHDLDERYYRMTLKYKKKFFPVMTLSLLFYIALPCVGAAVSANYLGSLTHHLVSVATIIVHFYISVRGVYYLYENDRLVSTVHRLIQEAEMEEETGV